MVLSNLENANKASRGSISQILLSALLSGDKYGYEICKDIEQRTNGRLILKQPSLYSSLRRMEEQKLIRSYWGDSNIGGRRHYYSITDKGREKYEKHKDDWESFDALIDSLPQSTFESSTQKTVEEKVENVNDGSSIYVVNQESLFNIRTKENKYKIKKVDEEDTPSTFLQFDLFNQSTSIITKKNSENTDFSHVENYSNKFAELDKHKSTIEPTELSSFEKVTDNEIKAMNKNDGFISDYQKENQESYSDFINDGLEEEKQQSFNFENILEDSAPVQSVNDNDEEENTDTHFDFNALMNETSEVNIVEEIKQPEKVMKLEDYPEVIPANQRIEDKTTEIFTKFESKKIENKNSDLTTPLAKTKTNSDSEDSLEYQNVIGGLYSEINKNDPYEQAKLKKFGMLEEGFEDEHIATKEPIQIDDEPQRENIVESDYQSPFVVVDKTDLANELKSEGIKFKTYKKLTKPTKTGNYISYYKLKFAQSWILWLVMFLEILATYFIVKNNGLLYSGHELVYYWGVGVISLYPIYYTLTFLFNRYKKVESNFKINISIFNKFLAMLICIVFIFAINLFIGMTSLNQIAYLSYWLLPTILATNLVLSSLIYFILLKTKKFYV